MSHTSRKRKVSLKSPFYESSCHPDESWYVNQLHHDGDDERKDKNMHAGGSCNLLMQVSTHTYITLSWTHISHDDHTRKGENSIVFSLFFKFNVNTDAPVLEFCGLSSHLLILMMWKKVILWSLDSLIFVTTYDVSIGISVHLNVIILVSSPSSSLLNLLLNSYCDHEKLTLNEN